MAKKFVPVFLMAFILLLTAVQAKAQGLVSFTFDDGWKSQFNVAFPIMANYGFAGTAYVYTDQIESRWHWKGFMEKEHLSILAKSGWEIGSHTKSHSSLSSLPFEKQDEELAQSREILEKYVSEVRTLSFPYRDFSEETLKLAEKYYVAFKGRHKKKVNLRPFPKLLDDFEVNQNVLLADIEFLLKEAKENDGWLILTFHQIDESESVYSVSRDKFAAICEAVKKSGLAVKTIREVVNENRGYYPGP